MEHPPNRRFGHVPGLCGIAGRFMGSFEACSDADGVNLWTKVVFAIFEEKTF
jgi:hypothetical protein